VGVTCPIVALLLFFRIATFGVEGACAPAIPAAVNRAAAACTRIDDLPTQHRVTTAPFSEMSWYRGHIE
jgi:hypothetical protein